MYSWPIKLKPYSDELLTSWLIRTSLANGTDPTSLTGAIWGSWRAWTVDIDRAIPVEKLTSLIKASGLSLEALKELTLQPTIEQITNTSDVGLKKAWTWVIPTGTRNRTRTNGLHFCSKCLQDDSKIYFKKSWRFAWNTVCPTHKILLSLSCPTCGSVIAPHLVTYKNIDLTRCQFCQNDLSLIKTFTTDEEVVNLQSTLNIASANKPISQEFPFGITDYRELFEVTHHLLVFIHKAYRKSEPFQKFFIALGLTLDDVSFSHFKGSTFETYPVLERYFLMLSVSRMFQFSKKEFIDILLKAGITKQMLYISEKQPKTISDIEKILPSNSYRVKAVKSAKKNIQARSKAEVDILMQEIKKFL